MMILSIRFTLIVLTAVALAGWIALWFKSNGGIALPGCGAKSGCDVVTRGRWSRWGPFPVAGLGVALYGFAFAASLLSMPNAPTSWRQIAWNALVSISPLAAGAAIWFITLQLFVIKRLCPYCMLVHAVGLGFTVVVAFGVGRNHYSSISPPILLAPSLIALVLLVIGQVASREKTYEFAPSATVDQKAVSEPSSTTPGVVAPAPVAKTSPSPNPFHNRTLVALDGKVILKGDRWPVLGSPLAKHILVYFFDYTCGTCRQLHHHLLTAIERSDNQLAVMAVPVPSDPTCNRHFCRRDPKHAKACAYARLGIAVWLADSDKYVEYDRYVFQDEDAPKITAAYAFARRLLPSAKLEDPEIAGPVYDKYLHEGIELHRTCAGGQTPVLLFPHGSLTGNVPTFAEFAHLVEQHVGLQLNAAGVAKSILKVGA